MPGQDQRLIDLDFCRWARNELVSQVNVACYIGLYRMNEHGWLLIADGGSQVPSVVPASARDKRFGSEAEARRVRQLLTDYLSNFHIKVFFSSHDLEKYFDDRTE